MKITFKIKNGKLTLPPDTLTLRAPCLSGRGTAECETVAQSWEQEAGEEQKLLKLALPLEQLRRGILRATVANVC